MKINFLFLGSTAAVVEATKSTTAGHLIDAVGHRNVTTMQALVQELADESVNEPGWKFDDDIKVALHAIRDTFVKSIQITLMDQHKQDQEHFNCFTQDCFGGCNSAFEGDSEKCRQLGLTCDEHGQSHEKCRNEVYAAYKDMATKCGALHCFDIADPECNPEDCLCPDLSFCHKATAYAGCEARDGQCKGKFGGWLQGQVTKYKEAYSEWRALYTECKSSYHAFLTEDKECDETQKLFERCLCEKSRCDYTSCGIDFAQCTEQCSTRYDELVKEKECLEKDRKIDWSATKKIECYIDVLLHDYTKKELLSKCGTDTCINKAREEDYKHCAAVCPEVDHDGNWPNVLSVEPGNVLVDGHEKRAKKDQYHLGDGKYKCDFNGDNVFTKHRSGVEWSDRVGEARCTEHLDIDYQVPECMTPECKKVPVCTAAFHKEYYAQFDDTSRIGCISDCCQEDGATCFDDVTMIGGSTGTEKIVVKEHSHAWAYNRCDCMECQGGFPEYRRPAENHQCGHGAHTVGLSAPVSAPLVAR